MTTYIPPAMSHEWDGASDWENSTASSESSFDDEDDEDDVNVRVYPDWCLYRNVIESRGFRLDTRRDVKQYYEQVTGIDLCKDAPGYSRACGVADDDSLCRDAGLPHNLFRGSRIRDKLRIIVKAVHLRSHEFDIIGFLSTSPQRDNTMNHCIPVLDMIPIIEESIGLIVMEEWIPQLIGDRPCCPRLFLGALQQCTDHLAFMHQNHIAHLDLSLHNVVTNDQGNCACIDFETSRRYDSLEAAPRIYELRTTEIPPEIERGEASDPFKIDVWALAVLFLRASELIGFQIPEIMALVKPMLNDNPDMRPSARMVQTAFNTMISTMFTTGRLDCPGTP